MEKFFCLIYVDDLSFGVFEVNVVYELYLKFKFRFVEGGFNLRKFVLNCFELINRI